MIRLIRLFAVLSLLAVPLGAQTRFVDGPEPPTVVFASLPAASASTGKVFRVDAKQAAEAGADSQLGEVVKEQ